MEWLPFPSHTPTIQAPPVAHKDPLAFVLNSSTPNFLHFNALVKAWKGWKSRSYVSGGWAKALWTHPEFSLHILQILKTVAYVKYP
jgi:hypothetical protein